MGVGRVIGPFLARAWSVSTWASLGWVASDVIAFFGASEEEGTGAAKASQKLVGAAFVVGGLLVWLLLTKMKRKR